MKAENYDQLMAQLMQEVNKDEPDYSYIKQLIHQTHCPHLINEMTAKYLSGYKIKNDQRLS
ncbi:MAG: hypothetical protein ACNS60_08280 [Candidatus Cyclobacteriaceae bacterium M2_1C_046]